MSADSEEDPFAIFEESSCESSDSVGKDKEERENRISELLTEVKKKKKRTTQDYYYYQSFAGKSEKVFVPPLSLEQKNEYKSNIGRPEYLLPIEPLYICADVKVVHMPTYGGGRGLICTQDLEAGTLILLEEPLLVWEETLTVEKLDLGVLSRILVSPRAQEILYAMEHLHPTRKDVIEQRKNSAQTDSQIRDMLRMTEDSLSNQDQVDTLLKLAGSLSLTNADGSSLEKLDFIRMILVLRYNALNSGFYLHAAMLNHNCAPNCDKFIPQPDQPHSETRTTRFVHAGEPLTISYIPDTLSHATRRKHLWQQHRFDIGVTPVLPMMEMVSGTIPVSGVDFLDSSGITYRVEDTIKSLMEIYNELSNTSPITSEMQSQYSDLDESLSMFMEEASRQLDNPRHLLLIPILQLQIDTSSKLLNLLPRNNTETVVDLLKKTVLACLQLQELLVERFGKDHHLLASNLSILLDSMGYYYHHSQRTKLNSDGRQNTALETELQRILIDYRNWTQLSHEELRRLKSLYDKGLRAPS